MPWRFVEQAVLQTNEMGDVLKNIVECRAMPNIMTYIMHVDHGISILLKKNSNSLDLKVPSFDKLKFKDFFFITIKNYLNVISNEETVKLI